MPNKVLASSIPFDVEDTLRSLGQAIRTARERRRRRQEDIAGRLGVTRHTVAKMEQGDPSVRISTYVGALWALNLLDKLDAWVDELPRQDDEGIALERSRSSHRGSARPKGRLSGDF